MRLVRVAGLAPLGAALALCVAVTCGSAQAAGIERGSWLLPAGDLAVPAFYSLGSPSVAVAADGTTVVAWARGEDGVPAVPEVVLREPGGAFSDPVLLSASPGPSGASVPAVAIGADGTAVAAWSQSTDQGGVVMASVRPPGGTFGAPTTVGSGRGFGSTSTVVTGDGTVIVGWSTSGPASPQGVPRVATRPPGGAFAAAVDLTVPAVDVGVPQLLRMPDDSVLAAWTRGSGMTTVLESASRAAGGSFGAAAELLPAPAPQYPRLAASPDGSLDVVWAEGNLARIATRPAGGSFGATVDFDTGGQVPDAPRIAIAADGTTTLVWRHTPPGKNTNVQAATRPPGGAFGTPEDLTPSVDRPPGPGSGSEDAYGPMVTAAADGTTTAAWSQATTSDGTRIQARTRLAGGSFGAPAFLSAAGFNGFQAAIASAADGATTVLWTESDGISRVSIQVGLTAGGPPVSLGSPRITGTPAAGSPLGCTGGRWAGAASPATRWLRDLAEVATGSSYTVTAADRGTSLTCEGRATNAAGSATRLSTSFAIPPAQAPPPPPPAPDPAPAPGPPPPPGPPADLTAPRVAIFTKQRLTLREFLRGVSVKLSADETATITAELRGRASKSRATGPYTRPLGSRRIFGVTGKAMTVRITPKRAAVGRVKSFSVRLRLIITDAQGNRRITGKTIRVSG